MSDNRLADALLGALAGSAPAAERVTAVLRALAEHARLSECHLYARESTASPFHLQQGWTGEARGNAPVLAVGAAQVGGALPQLDLTVELSEPLAEVSTQIGPMQALRLSTASLDALLLLRPEERALRRGSRRLLLETADVLAAVVSQLQRELALERQLTAAIARGDTSRRLQESAVGLEQFLQLLVDLAVSSTTSEGGFVAVADDAGRLAVRASTGMPPQAAALDLSPDTGMFDWDSAFENAPLMVRDPLQAAELGIRSVLAVPLQEEGRPLGVFALLTFSRAAAFDADALRLVAYFADQVGLMLDSARVFAQFTDRYLSVLEGIAGAVDARRGGALAYHAATGRLAGAIAIAHGMPLEDATAVRQAGRVHDVGLAALPGARDVYAVDVEHPAVGAGMLGSVRVPTAMVQAVECHHEWYDGWGFPHGLQGDQIPLGGRVLSLAAFAADVAAGDPLREPWEVDRIAEELRARSGTQFDPAVVETALPLLEPALTDEEG